MLCPFPAEARLSVIVPCYNSQRTIRECLRAILAQETSVPYEVIVVDSSCDDTRRIVAEEFPSVRLLRLPQRTPAGSARNVGARASQAAYCLMLDSDCIAAPDVIERMMARHAEGRYAAVGGALRHGGAHSVSGWIGYLMEFKEFAPGAPLRRERTVPTAVVTYRREALERHGYFDEDMWLSEDILFHARLGAAGGEILFDPAIQVTHLGRTGWRTMLRYQVDLGKWSAVARQRGVRPGGKLLRYTALIALMPFARTARAVSWLGKYDRASLVAFLPAAPLYFVAACFWSFGFWAQASGRAPAGAPAATAE